MANDETSLAVDNGRRKFLNWFLSTTAGAFLVSSAAEQFAFDVRMGTFSPALSIPVRLERRVGPLKRFRVAMGPYAEFRINGDRDRPKPCQLATSG